MRGALGLGDGPCSAVTGLRPRCRGSIVPGARSVSCWSYRLPCSSSRGPHGGIVGGGVPLATPAGDCSFKRCGAKPNDSLIGATPPGAPGYRRDLSIEASAASAIESQIELIKAVSLNVDGSTQVIHPGRRGEWGGRVRDRAHRGRAASYGTSNHGRLGKVVAVEDAFAVVGTGPTDSAGRRGPGSGCSASSAPNPPAPSLLRDAPLR
jgi:hypothetical protein